MNIKWICIIFCAAFFSNALSLNGAGAKNLLYNSGFEDSGYIYDWRISGCTSKIIKEQKDTESGRQSVLLIKSGGKAAYIENKRPRIRVVAGETYELSIMAKGHGEIQLSCILFGGTPLHLKGLGIASSKSFVLNDKWQRFTYKHTFTKSDILEFSCRIYLKGNNAKAYLDAAVLKQKLKYKASFKISKTSFMSYPGQKIKFKLNLEYAAQNCSEKLQISSKLKALYKNGEISLTVPKNSLNKTYKLNLFDRSSGLGQDILIEVFSKKQYDSIMSAAKSIVMPDRILNVLVLGDSLSDLFRGQNYVDWLKFWTSRIEWSNYGVRGDYISRILKRIEGKKVWGARRFDGILQNVPDLVLIFCGHNDSRLTKSSKFKKTKVSVSTFEKDLISTINFLRGKNPNVKIILMTPAASNFVKSKAVWENKSKRSDLFGKPEIMQKFQQAVKNAAKKENCDFIDIFKLTKECPDNSELFQADGVHLNSNGNYFVALKVLEWLAKSKYFKQIKQ